MTASTHAPEVADLEPGSAVDALRQSLEALMAAQDPAIFIQTAATEDLHARAVFLDSLAEELPLRGLTFAVKDNIDVAGLATTCACPEYAYVAERSAPVVTRLEDAGALCIGKTNMDQFATGLVGTRSPHGTPKNPVDVTLVPGGSSSGSAVAVARGIVDFALGTDTAGSGRVPAAMCGIVGVKPTVGRLPASGVVPAVRSIDCVSIFTDSLALAKSLLSVASGRDDADAFSRDTPDEPVATVPRRLGVVDRATLEAAGAVGCVADAYEETIAALEAAGAELVPFDLAPFLAVGDLLYGGPWVAERTAAVGDFVAAHPGDVDPVVGPIIMGGEEYSAVDAHLAGYRLKALASGPVADELARFDAFVLPTIPFGPSRTDVEADPVGVNSAVGRFTTFVNLLDLCALAVPTPFAPAPVGMTFLAPAWHDEVLLDLAAGLAAGELPGPAIASPVALAVAGAHLKGQPLASQLEDLGAIWAETTTTAASYRMYALADGPPFKPALVHDPDGVSLEVDLWHVDDTMLGSFLQMIPAPLALGQVELADGRSVVGFVSEGRAVDGATEITQHGGWRNYVGSLG